MRNEPTAYCKKPKGDPVKDYAYIIHQSYLRGDTHPLDYRDSLRKNKQGYLYPKDII